MHGSSRWHRSLLAPLLVLVGLVALTSCRQSRRQVDGPLVVAAYGSIQTVDPAQATTVIALQLISALGDPLYASGSARDYSRLMLHSEELRLHHPDSGQGLKFRSKACF